MSAIRAERDYVIHEDFMKVRRFPCVAIDGFFESLRNYDSWIKRRYSFMRD